MKTIKEENRLLAVKMFDAVKGAETTVADMMQICGVIAAWALDIELQQLTPGVDAIPGAKISGCLNCARPVLDTVKSNALNILSDKGWEIIC